MRIGIIGGSGYVGSELLRLLLMHPEVEVTMVTSRQSRRRIRLQRAPKPQRFNSAEICAPRHG